MQVFFLSREQLELAKAELSAFAKNPCFIKNLGFSETKKEPSGLAMTKTAGRFLFKSDVSELKQKSSGFNWSRYCANNFCVQKVSLDNTRFDIKKIAGIIHQKTGIQAEMKNPDTLFEIFLCNGIAYVTKRTWQNTSEFMQRKSHKRPAPHPTSLHPKLARAMVNLTGIRKGTIVDPFCGSGGILLEAALTGVKVKGYDLLEKMLEMSEVNLKHWNIKNYDLKLKNALELEKCRYVVTDPPYGKNSSARQLKELYRNFLRVLGRKLTKRAVVVFPHFFDYRQHSRQAGLKIEQEFEWYIHKSMTRHVVVLSKLV